MSLLVILAVGAADGLAGIAVAPGATPVWMCLIGLARDGARGLALILPVLGGGSAHAVTSLNGDVDLGRLAELPTQVVNG